jgi:hypothetical protein
VAQFFLEQAGYEVYLPLVRWRTRRRCTRVTPLFPGYCFTRIELQWHAIRQCPGVIRIVRCGGDEPSHVPDEVIAEIRSREHHGAIDLRKERKRLKAGDRVQIIDGILADRRGYYAGETPRHINVVANARKRAPGAAEFRRVRANLTALSRNSLPGGHWVKATHRFVFLANGRPLLRDSPSWPHGLFNHRLNPGPPKLRDLSVRIAAT